MMKKTAILKVRLTEAQHEDIKLRSLPFGSMSNYVLQALREFSNSTALDRMNAAKTVADTYASFDAKLAHVGGNLNQAMKHVNEHAKAGADVSGKLVDMVLPEVQACYRLCSDLRKAIYKLTKDVVHH